MCRVTALHGASLGPCPHARFHGTNPTSEPGFQHFTARALPSRKQWAELAEHDQSPTLAVLFPSAAAAGLSGSAASLSSSVICCCSLGCAFMITICNQQRTWRGCRKKPQQLALETEMISLFPRPGSTTVLLVPPRGDQGLLQHRSLGLAVCWGIWVLALPPHPQEPAQCRTSPSRAGREALV